MRWLMLVPLAMLGCYSPDIADGRYLCTDTARTCPDGLACNSCRACVASGSRLDAGACESCQTLVTCYSTRACTFGDVVCEQSCVMRGTPLAAQLANTALTCIKKACTTRCATMPNSLDCSLCLYNVIRGTGAVSGACVPAADAACNACVISYNACAADTSGN